MQYFYAKLHFFEDKTSILPHFFEDKIAGSLHFFEDKTNYNANPNPMLTETAHISWIFVGLNKS